MSENNIQKARPLHGPPKNHIRVVVDLHRATVKAILRRAAMETKAQGQKITRTDILREVLMQWEKREPGYRSKLTMTQINRIGKLADDQKSKEAA